MRAMLACAILSLCTSFVLADGTPPEKTFAEPDRISPVVRAVRKVEDSVVAVKVLRIGASKESTGTGIIVDERGYIVTNLHVLRRAERTRVLLADGTAVKAEAVFEEPRLDLAVLRIVTDKQLKALQLGPASDLFRGEEVIAIGHPFGYEQSVTKGIISAVKRNIDFGDGLVLSNLIPHSASINPGNSGGPLLNIKGELIGINVAIRQDAQGIAFALNADDVQKALCRFLSARQVSGLSHGLEIQEKVQGNANDADRQVVLVKTVSESSPAARAGLKQGDRVVQVGQRKVANGFDLERALWSVNAGDKVPVKVVRAGQEMELNLVVQKEDVSTPHKQSARR